MSGKQHYTNHFYSADKDLLTSTQNIVGQWKEYAITEAEITEIVNKVLGDKTLGVDEICPVYLKSLPLQHCVVVGNTAIKLADQDGGTSF